MDWGQGGHAVHLCSGSDRETLQPFQGKRRTGQAVVRGGMISSVTRPRSRTRSDRLARKPNRPATGAKATRDAQFEELQRQLAEANAKLAAMEARPTASAEASERSVAVGGDVTDSTLVVADQIILKMSGSGPWQREVFGVRKGQKDDPETLRRFLRYIHERHVFVEFRGLGMTGKVPLKLRLEEIYVPPRARVEMPEGETWSRTLKVSGRDLPDADRQAMGERVGPPQPVERLFEEHPGLIVLGDPGSGKTSFLKYLALRHATDQTHPKRFPVYLPLAAYAEHLAQANTGEALSPEEFIPQYYAEQGVGDISGMFDRALQQGRALVLLDGLDEARLASVRRKVVDRVASLFQRHRDSGNKFVMTSRIVGYAEVRPSVEGLEECWLADFDDSDIEAFAERWTRAVERRERGAGQVTDHEAEARRRELLHAVATNPGVRRLAASPILLTILALMQKAGERLPDRRAKLYERCLDTMLSTWNAARSAGHGTGEQRPTGQTTKVLGPLALWMHEHDDGYGLVPKERLRRELRVLLLRRALGTLPRGEASKAAKDAADLEVEEFMKDVHGQCSVLLERARGRYGFLHQTFQEYLAGVGLVLLEDTPAEPGSTGGNLGEAGVIRRMQECLGSDESRAVWREPLLLAAGFAGLVQGRETFAANMLRGWIATGTKGLLLAGEATADLGAEALGRACLEEVRSALDRLWDDRIATPLDRANAGRWIGVLGDRRPGVGTVPRAAGQIPSRRPDFLWCGCDPSDPTRPFPAGPFLMGGDPTAHGSSEEPFECHRIRDPFFIARYPVTVAQYQLFVDEGGYENDVWWPGAAQQWRDGGAKDWEWAWQPAKARYLKRRFPIRHPEDFEPPFQAPNSPRVGLSWFEASAYALWLQGRFQQEDWGPGSGWRPRLCSEAEWELASRWDGVSSQRWHPWPQGEGDQRVSGRCNFDSAGIGRTSAVGLFSPEGDAWCGPADMLGNVWEWCRDPWTWLNSKGDQRAFNAYDDISVPADARRVLRGGSWADVASEYQLCASRFISVPGDANRVVGFRVVCVLVSTSGG
jgi:formylglycine-generating enzyme required for sulfatase activity